MSSTKKVVGSVRVGFIISGEGEGVFPVLLFLAFRQMRQQLVEEGLLLF